MREKRIQHKHPNHEQTEKMEAMITPKHKRKKQIKMGFTAASCYMLQPPLLLSLLKFIYFILSLLILSQLLLVCSAKLEFKMNCINWGGGNKMVWDVFV